MNYAGSLKKLSSWWWFGVIVFVAAAALRWSQLAVISEPIFDEVHYVPAAEVLTGLKPHPGMGVWAFHPLIGKAPAPNFEHPLLGKFLIGFGMKIFGSNAFGWRFFACLMGCVSLGLMTCLAWRFTQRPGLAILVLFLMGFDTMHLLHSRLAMLDIFLLTALIGLLLSSYALIAAPERWSLRGLAALCLALGFSIKWVFAFAVLGFCWCLLFLGQGSWKLRFTTLIWIGLMALGLYNLWFFYYQAHGFSYSEWLQFHLAANSVTTGKLADHPYGASALSMLFNSRNIWYYFKQLPNQTTVGLVCLMNPLLIFSTLPAMGFLFSSYLSKRDRRDAFILGWFVCCYGPFFLVLLARQGFLYYMLFVEPIIILALCRVFASMEEQGIRPYWRLLYAVAFLGFTLFFLPVALALPMPSEIYLWIVRLTGV